MGHLFCLIFIQTSEGPVLCILMNKTRCLSFQFNVKSPWTVTGTKRIFTCAGTPGSWIICWRLCSFLKLPRVTCSIESAFIYSTALRVSPSLLFVLMCHHSWGMRNTEEHCRITDEDVLVTGLHKTSSTGGGSQVFASFFTFMSII